MVAVPVVTCGCDKTSKNMFVLCCIKQNVYRCTLVVFLYAHPVVFFCNPPSSVFVLGRGMEKKNDKNIFIKKTTSFIFSCHILPTTTPPWWHALFRGPTKNLLFAFLYVEEMLVKSQFRTFKNISIGSSALSGSGRDAGKETVSCELIVDVTANVFVFLFAFAHFTCGVFAFLFLLHIFYFATFFGTDFNTVPCFVPTGKRVGINGDNAAFDQRVGTD